MGPNASILGSLNAPGLTMDGEKSEFQGWVAKIISPSGKVRIPAIPETRDPKLLGHQQHARCAGSSPPLVHSLPSRITAPSGQQDWVKLRKFLQHVTADPGHVSRGFLFAPWTCFPDAASPFQHSGESAPEQPPAKPLPLAPTEGSAILS